MAIIILINHKKKKLIKTMNKDENQGKNRLTFDNRLIRDYIFEDCFSSLSFEFLSVNNLSNSIDINENITYN